MKKTILIAFFVFGGILLGRSALQSFSIPLQVQFTDVEVSSGHGGYPRTPVARPNVCLDGHTLYFNNVGYDLTLVLLDDEENEVYSALVPAGATAAMLPSSLNGTYELQLYPGGSYYFFSDITLY